ncbi:hypothetical protein K2X40_03260 [Candidatus Babeliales bacterium]|nr:hypothetical protein [Candidatus Babeliales bacterium]MBY0353137.1 hypothetical protein [Candidatus Babeliales bacterium]
MTTTTLFISFVSGLLVGLTYAYLFVAQLQKIFQTKPNKAASRFFLQPLVLFVARFFILILIVSVLYFWLQVNLPVFLAGFGISFWFYTLKKTKVLS